MLSIARDGISLFISEDFHRQREPSKLAKLATELGNWYAHHAYQLLASGKALVFRYSDLKEEMFDSKLSFQMTPHWTTKPPKVLNQRFKDALGRFLCNPKRKEGNTFTPLNSEEAMIFAELMFGETKLPQVLDFVRRLVIIATSTSIRCQRWYCGWKM